MNDPVETPLRPVRDSADGKLNAYTRHCGTVGYSMNYAACLARQATLANSKAKPPADWSACVEAARNASCHALHMRREEELKGHAIYFHAREVIPGTPGTGRTWIMPGTVRREAPIRTHMPSVTTPYRAKSMFEVMAEAPSYADAINASTTITATRAPAMPRPAQRPPIQPGESPLAYARRIAAIGAQPASAVQPSI